MTMAFGTKTNERPGTRAQARHVHTSAYKAREVLDLIRGESCGKALEILQFTERDIAQVIQKCLESAMANAEHNDGIPQDELYIASCFADEGPTLKRWRPRARGRATRIRKRTCHITVIVSRYEADELERLRAREASGASSSRSAVEARRRRVQRSRETAAARAAEEEHDHDHDGHDHDDHDHDHDQEVEETQGATGEATVDTGKASTADAGDSPSDAADDTPEEQ